MLPGETGRRKGIRADKGKPSKSVILGRPPVLADPAEGKALEYKLCLRVYLTLSEHSRSHASPWLRAPSGVREFPVSANLG